MSIYLKSSIELSADGLSSRQVRVKDAEPVVAPEASDVDVELVDEPEGEKPVKSHTVPELVEIAKGLGVSEDSVKHLKKAELLEAIERLTHTSDD